MASQLYPKGKKKLLDADIDLLVDMEKGRSLFDQAALLVELRELLGAGGEAPAAGGAAAEENAAAAESRVLKLAKTGNSRIAFYYPYLSPGVLTSVALDERFTEAHYLLGLCLRDRANEAGALEALTRAVAINPAFAAAREELADLFERVDRRRPGVRQPQRLIRDAGGESAQRELSGRAASAPSADRDRAGSCGCATEP